MNRIHLPELNNPLTPLDQTLLYYTALISAANLIPVPFVDDYIVQRIRLNMIKDLGKACGNLRIPSKEANEIARHYAFSFGCGAAGGFFFWKAIKSLIKDIVILLDISTSAGLVVDTYLFGYLLADVYSSGNYQPGKARDYGDVMHNVIKQAPKKSIVKAFKDSLRTAKKLLHAISQWLRVFLRYYFWQAVSGVWGKSVEVVGHKLPGKVREKVEEIKFDKYLDEKSPDLRQLFDDVMHIFQVNLQSSLVQQFLETLKGDLAKELTARSE